MKLKTKGYNETVRELKQLMNNSDVLGYFEELVKMIEIQIPILASLNNPTLRPRHVLELEEAIGVSLPPTLKFEDIKALNLHLHKDTMVSVALKAEIQKSMEDKLEEITKELKTARVPLQEGYKEDLFYLGDLRSLEDLFMKADLTFHTLLNSQYALHIKEFSVKWKNTLILMKKTMDSLKDFEKSWKILEPLMSRKSTSEIFPMQAAMFDATNNFWKRTVIKFKNDTCLHNHLNDGQFFHELEIHYFELKKIRNCLEPLLAVRRNTFPRFYLLPDDQLLDILTQTQDSLYKEDYLATIFTGISSFQRNSDGDIVALVSPEEEVLTLNKSVLAHHGIEDWLSRMESGMKATIKRLILQECQKEDLKMDNEVPVQVINNI
ncbi:Dynein heavy chain 6, axonemal [Armadillidium nasatum]|uniref:Dynein heavy chain 6, axonemal n=1 Tax=Armadillidium nasatum TaxID=96803 RepID=A0A5N5SJS7_9CRUS|nr:Dynein heavy chain 6, axonemal [Armadillidium nasatum]